jgi:membrane protein implicated in regulation of membrane protease activity
MNIILVSGVQQLLPTPATRLVLLTLLALSTFLAGISLLSAQVAFLGVAMCVAVSAISWLQQSVIFFLLGAVLLIGLGMTFWLRQDHDQARAPNGSPANTRSQTEV